MPSLLLSEYSFLSCTSRDASVSSLLKTCRAISLMKSRLGAAFRIYLHSSPATWKDQSGSTIYQIIGLVRDSEREAATLTLSLLANSDIIHFEDYIPAEFINSREIRFSPSEIIDDLMSCIFSSSRILSLGAASPFDQNRLEFELLSLEDDGQVNSTVETVDNISTVEHATNIIEAMAAEALTSLTPRSCRSSLALVFPHLLFPERVIVQLEEFNIDEIGAIFSRLGDLESPVVAWRRNNLNYPNWQCVVTGESSSTMNDPKTRKLRVFKCTNGEDEMFELHAKVGGNRIHLRVLNEEKIIEIGYIGPHLPT